MRKVERKRGKGEKKGEGGREGEEEEEGEGKEDGERGFDHNGVEILRFY